MVNKIKNMFSCGCGAEVYKKCLETVNRYGMTEKIKNGVLVGFSGGADSVMLLSFFSLFRESEQFPILAVHVNHSIRGEEADRDEAFSREFAKALGVEFLSVKIDVPALAESQGIGIEEAARCARYETFEKIISSRAELNYIAVAHNSTDNLETVIFNLMRGAGTLGLAGISPVRDNILRPLIASTKSDIATALVENGIPYVTDSSNLSDEYTRNYIRLEIIPKLSRLAASPEEMAIRASENLRMDDCYITSQAEEFLKSREKLTNKELTTLHFSLFTRVVAIFSRKCGCKSLERVHYSDLYELLKRDNFSYSLPGNFNWICEYGECKIEKNIAGVALFGEIRGTETEFADLGLSVLYSFDREAKTSSNVYKFSIQANLSSAIISGRVYFRSKNDGDSYKYGGATRKLKKLFNDRKIPPSVRDKIPVFCDDSGILWVPGFGVRDDGVKENNGFLTLFVSEKTELFIPTTIRK